MTVFVSYCELGLEPGGKQGCLGSGSAEEIFRRSHTDPCIRICLQEPSDGTIGFRARFYVAKLTPDGPVPIFEQDPTEERGAWARLLPISSRVMEALQRACGGDSPDSVISAGLITGWLKVEEDVVTVVDAETARRSLAEPILDPESRVFVRLSCASEQLLMGLRSLPELNDTPVTQQGGNSER